MEKEFREKLGLRLPEPESNAIFDDNGISSIQQNACKELKHIGGMNKRQLKGYIAALKAEHLEVQKVVGALADVIFSLQQLQIATIQTLNIVASKQGIATIDIPSLEVISESLKDI